MLDGATDFRYPFLMQELTIHTDGGARGNPGPSAIGVVFTYPEGQDRFARTIGTATNNVAEYSAVLEAIAQIPAIIARQGNFTSITFNLDSELVVKQIGGQYRVKEPTLQGLHARVIQGLRSLSLPYKVQHVRRAQNAAADKLVNQALDGTLDL